MALTEDLAEALARDVIAAQRDLGEKADRLFMEVGNYIGTSSPSMQEAFMTACRAYMAADRGRDFFETRLKALRGE